MSSFIQLIGTPSLRCRVITMIESIAWNEFITAVYGRRYDYQQQDGCRSRGTVDFTASTEGKIWGFDDATPEELMEHRYNMGVSLKSWLGTDPKDLTIDWECHFYPSLDELAQDLCKRGLLPAGSYTLNIDW